MVIQRLMNGAHFCSVLRVNCGLACCFRAGSLLSDQGVIATAKVGRWPPDPRSSRMISGMLCFLCPACVLFVIDDIAIISDPTPDIGQWKAGLPARKQVYPLESQEIILATYFKVVQPHKMEADWHVLAFCQSQSKDQGSHSRHGAVAAAFCPPILPMPRKWFAIVQYWLGEQCCILDWWLYN